MHRAWVMRDYSGFNGLSLEQFPDEEPGPGEVRLRIEAFALNWGDMDLMEDRYSYSFSSFPARIGMEAAGIVDAIGPDVDDIEVGERYCTLPHFYDNRGASGESLIVKARYLTRAPAGLSAVESASIWMQYLTAYFPIVELAKAQPGRVILVTAATEAIASNAGSNSMWPMSDLVRRTHRLAIRTLKKDRRWRQHNTLALAERDGEQPAEVAEVPEPAAPMVELVRLLNQGEQLELITVSERDLIVATRCVGYGITELAELTGSKADTLKHRRARAESRLIAGFSQRPELLEAS